MQDFSVGDVGVSSSSNFKICLYNQDEDFLTAIPNFITCNTNTTIICLNSEPWKPLWFKWFNHKKTGFEPQKNLFKVLLTHERKVYVGYLEEEVLNKDVIWKE